MRTAPCKGCQHRHSACHDQCEAFAKWKTERAEMSRNRWLAKDGYTADKTRPIQVRFHEKRRMRYLYNQKTGRK